MMKKTALTLSLSLLSLSTLMACHKKEDAQRKEQPSLGMSQDDEAKALANRRAATRPVQVNPDVHGY